MSCIVDMDAINAQMKLLEANIEKDIAATVTPAFLATMTPVQIHYYAITLSNQALEDERVPIIGLRKGYFIRQIAKIQLSRREISPTKASAMQQIASRIIEQYRDKIVLLTIENIKCGY
uniref:Phage protein n=1 Tax=Panagrellus redivivus TaxID=6233 RepID=A0A7E4V454_PANRE